MPFTPDPGSIQLAAPSAGGLVPDAGSIQLAPAPAAPEAPGGLESFGRGALQGASFGLSDEIGGAIGSLFSDKSYTQVRDEIRAGDKAAHEAHPFLSGAGELAGGAATMFVPGLNVAKGASLGKTALSLGAQGALAGFGGSEATDASGLIKDTAIGGAIGAGIGAATHGIGKLVEGAPAKAIEDRAAAVSQGSGLKGSATMTTKKALAQDVEGVDAALTESFKSESSRKPITLSSIMRDPAKEVMPVVDERLDQVGKQLDPIYKKFNEAEGGGMSLHNFVNFVDDEIATLQKKPLQEKWIGALQDVKDSAIKAWGPEGMAEKLRGNATATAMGLDSPMFAKLDDVKVPYEDFRSMVTQLQKRGTKTLDTLHPGESTQVKADVAQSLRDFLNADLERVGDNHPSLSKQTEELMGLNRLYSNTARIRDAVEERFWKENGGNTSARGHVGTMVGGLVGAGVGGMIPIPIVGHALGAAVGAAAGGKAQVLATGAREAATQQLANVQEKIAQLTQRAAQGDQRSAVLLRAMKNSPEIMARLSALHATANGSDQ